MKCDPIILVTAYEIAGERLNLSVFIKPWCLKGLFGISPCNDDEGVEGFGGTYVNYTGRRSGCHGNRPDVFSALRTHSGHSNLCKVLCKNARNLTTCNVLKVSYRVK